MTAIFVSYRRSDTLPWATHLFGDLSRHLGKAQVFMDIHGGIPRGANFEQVLTDAVSCCDALLALIGPAWLHCTRSDGRRRLDVPGDWVCNEIATGLRRGVPVVPVLFGGVARPAAEDLPDDLQPLARRQEARIDDAQWNHDVALLLRDLLRQLPSLQLLQPIGVDDVDSASSGIGVLRQLIERDRSVAEAVARSKEVVQTSYERIGRLERYKGVHDALHGVEFECLRPLQAGGAATRVRPFRARFAAEAARVEAAIAGGDMPAGLRDDIADGLAATADAFAAALAAPGEAAHARLVGELNALLSGLAPRLDVGIAETARELNLDRLIELMSGVRARIAAPPDDAASAAFAAGIDALLRLRDELSLRVQEHTQLQRLDAKLRAVCVGGVAPVMLASEFNRIRLIRARLVPPLSAELQAAGDDLAALEREIDAHLARQEEGAALDALQEYFRVAADAFRNVDRALKDFALRLSAVSQPLKTILDLV
jgi:hypothetical protein